MRKWTALYYPHVEPPIAWLRSAALLFDRVTSFVPKDSDESLSDDLLRFAEKTDAWEPHRPSEDTADLVGGSLERLDAAFAEIATERKYAPDRFEMTFIHDHVGNLRIKDRVFLHDSKLSLRIQHLLRKHNLLLPKAVAEPLRPGNWWLVDEKASNLLLAQIADNLAALKGWASVTDDNDCYTFTSRDFIGGSARVVEGQVARIMIAELIPDSIDEMPLDRYVDLRLRYEPMREEVTRFVTDIIREDRLADIGDPQALRVAVADAVRELRKELERFRESAVGTAIRKWSPFGIGGLLTLASGALPVAFGLPVAAAKLTIAGVEKSGITNRKAVKRGELLRLMSAARDEILQPARYDREKAN
jgi:hypothetical protein